MLPMDSIGLREEGWMNQNPDEGGRQGGQSNQQNGSVGQMDEGTGQNQSGRQGDDHGN